MFAVVGLEGQMQSTAAAANSQWVFQTPVDVISIYPRPVRLAAVNVAPAAAHSGSGGSLVKPECQSH